MAKSSKKTPSDNLVGKRIRALRTIKEITLLDLSKKCNVAYQNLSSIEIGSKGLSVSLLVTIAKALGTSTDYLLGLTDMPTSTDDPTIKEVLSIFRTHNPDNKAVMLSTLRALSQNLGTN